MCRAVQPVLNGVVKAPNMITVGTHVTIACNDGYRIDRSQLTEVTIECENTGLYSIDPYSLQCKPVRCDVLEPLANGQVEASRGQLQQSTKNDLTMDITIDGFEPVRTKAKSKQQR